MYQSLLTFSAQNITYLLLRINKQCVSEEMIDRHAKSICDVQIGGQFCVYPARLYFRYLLLAHICLFCKLLLRYTLPPAKPTNILPQHFMKSFRFEVIIVIYRHGCIFLIADNGMGSPIIRFDYLFTFSRPTA